MMFAFIILAVILVTLFWALGCEITEKENKQIRKQVNKMFEKEKK